MTTRWPHAFRQVAKLIGDEAAREICRLWGGIELYVPKRFRPGHRLLEAIGQEAAAKLAVEYGGNKLHPPVMRMERELKTEIAAASGTLTEVARRFGVTRTWVSMVRNGRN